LFMWYDYFSYINGNKYIEEPIKCKIKIRI